MPGLVEESRQQFVARLQSASPQFADLWERHDVAPVGKQTKYVRHPDVGMLKFEPDSLYTQAHGDVRLVVYAPGDDATLAKLRALAARAGDVTTG